MSLNKQDMEEIANIVNYRLMKLTHVENVQAYKKTCIKRESYKKIVKSSEYDKMCLDYYTEFYVHANYEEPFDYSEIMSIIENMSEVKKLIFYKYLKLGSLEAVSKELNINYNTCKANFRWGILELRNKLRR